MGNFDSPKGPQGPRPTARRQYLARSVSVFRPRAAGSRAYRWFGCRTILTRPSGSRLRETPASPQDLSGRGCWRFGQASRVGHLSSAHVYICTRAGKLGRPSAWLAYVFCLSSTRDEVCIPNQCAIRAKLPAVFPSVPFPPIPRPGWHGTWHPMRQARFVSVHILQPCRSDPSDWKSGCNKVLTYRPRYRKHSARKRSTSFMEGFKARTQAGRLASWDAVA